MELFESRDKTGKLKIDLWQGDCLELMKNIPDNSIDMCLTDPPYGTTACSWDNIIPFEPMWEQIHRIVKPNGAIALFGSEPFSSALRMSNTKNFKYDWIWDKVVPTGHLNAKRMPMKVHETISIFYKKQTIYNRQMSDKPMEYQRKNRLITKTKEYETNIYGKSRRGFAGDSDYTKTNPKSIIQFSNGNGYSKIGNHPTQKPVDLLEYLIKTYTLEGETILDFTMGSGSTGVAAINTNRNFIGIELDPEYFKIAQDRINLALKGEEYSTIKKMKETESTIEVWI